MYKTFPFTVNNEAFEVFIFTVDGEIKILDLLKSSSGVSWKEIHIEGLPYYGVVAKVRDYEKKEFTTNIEGILGITEKGIEYLNQLLDFLPLDS